MKSLSIICLLLNIFLASSFFQTSLFKEINKEHEKKNLLISPLSVYQVLGLTANGAKGETLDEMLLALGNANLEEVNTINKLILNAQKGFKTVEIANAVMTRQEPKKSFVLAASLYEATVENLKDLAHVNDWCNLKTHGKIEKILENLDPNAVMILLNVIYFKGAWKTEFNETETTEKTFNNFNDKEQATKVVTMSLKEKLNYYEDKEKQIVELPYKDDSMSAIIILPYNYKNINDYVAELEDDKLQGFLKNMSPKLVQLELPKFQLDCSVTFESVLQNMGMNLPFSEASDFTGIVADPSVYISSVVQKSFLSVDEKGSEASSATSETISTKGPPPEFTPMLVDRPFLFMLRNKKFPINYEMLFMAKVEDLKQ